MAAPGVRIRLPAVFRADAGGRAAVRVEAATVGEALGTLCRAYPALAARLLAADGGPRRYVSVFVNDEDARQLGGPNAALAEGDELTIVPALSGGASGEARAGMGGEGAPAPGVEAPRAAVARIAALAEASPGAEICGFVLAGGRSGPEVVPVRNAAADPAHAFAMAPADVLRVLRAADRDGREIAAVYHSHVTASACLSAADAAGLAVGGRPALPGAEVWIVGVERGRAIEVRGYRFAGPGWGERFRDRGPFTA